MNRLINGLKNKNETMETVNTICTAVSQLILTILSMAVLYIMFWQPKDRFK